jgi:hypothetical protein
MRTNSRLQVLFILTICIIVSLKDQGWAQGEIPTRVNAQNRTGLLPFSTQIGTDIEKVDVVTGNLNVNIPIVSIQGRGMPFEFGLTYNSLFWIAARRVDVWNNDVSEWQWEYRGLSSPGLGWNETRPSITSVTQTIPCIVGGQTEGIYRMNFIYQDPQGGKHPLAVQQSLNSNCVINDTQGPDLTGEGIWAVMPGPLQANIRLPDGTLYDPDGLGLSRDSNGTRNRT